MLPVTEVGGGEHNGIPVSVCLSAHNPFFFFSLSLFRTPECFCVCVCVFAIKFCEVIIIASQDVVQFRLLCLKLGVWDGNPRELLSFLCIF